jgi:transketolase
MLTAQPHTVPAEPTGSRTLRSSRHDHVTLFATGITVPEALAAADLLATTGIQARVIDLASVEPLDTSEVLKAASETGNLVAAEDHSPDGGVGEAVRNALAAADSDARVQTLAVHATPSTSAHRSDQLWRSGIDRTWIATAARDLLEQIPAPGSHRRGLASLLERFTAVA